MKLKTNTLAGIIIAIIIIAAWTLHLYYLLSTPMDSKSYLQILLGIIVQAYLYTGLFITAHDAMHINIAPNQYKTNKAIGTLAVRLYAFFSFSNLNDKHFLHHRYPATPKDPDYHDEKHQGFLTWYLKFMRGYIQWTQLLGMAVIFNILKYIFDISTANLILFWIVPAFMSTFQLFYFGTFLPHKKPDEGYTNPHRAKSNDYPVWLSFLSCYHFGYHWEHHEYPNIPWWALPKKRP